MKRRILSILAALSLMTSGAMAQTLTVADVSATVGANTTIEVAISGATEMTALQLNLALPEGVALDGGITLGDAANGHTLSVSPLTSGEHLIVLYSMYQTKFTDGTLLTIPVSVADDATSAEGNLRIVRTATVGAVSHTLSDVTFAVTVAGEEEPETKYYWYVGTSTEESLITPDNYKDYCTKVASMPSELSVSVNDEYLYVVLPANKELVAYDPAGVGELAFKYYRPTLSKFSPVKNREVRITFDDDEEYVIYRSSSTANTGEEAYRVVVSDEVPVTEIAINQSSASVTEGETLSLEAVITPADATWDRVMWSSSDENIAIIDNNGVVTAVTAGVATITAAACDDSGVSATCVVTVESATVEEPETIASGKNYRVKNVTTGLYLQVSGNNTNMTIQNKAEGVELSQVFQLEDAGEGMYYIKAADLSSSYYAHASGWNFNATANAANKTPFTIALVEGETQVYTLHQSVSAYPGLAGADDSAAGAAIYCNKGVDNNGKWAFEALTEEENATYTATLTATARQALEAAIARAETVVSTRSAALTSDEVTAINSAVATAKAEKDNAADAAALTALAEAIHTAVDEAVYVWNTDALSNAMCYTVSTEDRGAWYAQASNLTSTAKAEAAVDVADSKQQFAFVKSEKSGALYLYSVSEAKFVSAADGYTALTETPVQTVAFLNGTRSAQFPWVVALNAEDGQKQMGISNGYDPAVITHYNDLKDAGNTVRIEKVAAFDATAALAAIDAFENPVIAVSGITLSQTTATLTEGETLTLTAAIAPDNATDKTVVWSSSDKKVATVDNNGKVTAIAVGTATITVTAGDKEATCVVTVESPTGIENSEFIIQNSEFIYDLMGRKVEKATKGGVYIINGKRVLVK